MQFPVFTTPYLGTGMTIGLNAIIHVMISHGLAIGAFAIIILSDRVASYQSNALSDAWERFNRTYLKFTVITATVAGSATGAGIWFTTNSLASRGIANMVRTFFWPWYIEFGVFLLEVIALLVIYFSWGYFSGPRRHWRSVLGLVYALLVVASGFLITGILGFMLTPGSYYMGQPFYEAFFNPSFFPQLLVRLSMAFVLGGLLAMVFLQFSRESDEFFRSALKLFGMIVTIAFTLFIVGLIWYALVLPTMYIQKVPFSVLTSHLSDLPYLYYVANILGFVIMILICIAAWRQSKRASRILIVPALVVFMGFVTEFERIRESIRSPYLMPGYLYSNGVLVDEVPVFKERGMLNYGYWMSVSAEESDPMVLGAKLFAQNCATCHTLQGINSIADRMRGRSEDGIYVILGNTNEIVGFMPPFAGSDAERRLTARFLYKLTTKQLEMKSLARHVPVTRGYE